MPRGRSVTVLANVLVCLILAATGVIIGMALQSPPGSGSPVTLIPATSSAVTAPSTPPEVDTACHDATLSADVYISMVLIRAGVGDLGSQNDRATELLHEQYDTYVAARKGCLGY